jgi:hypothetical protein
MPSPQPPGTPPVRNEARTVEAPSAIEALAAVIVELRADLDEMRARLDAMTEPAAVPAEFIPLKLAAARTGFHPETLRGWAAAGRISAHRSGGRWYVLIGPTGFLDSSSDQSRSRKRA